MGFGAVAVVQKAGRHPWRHDVNILTIANPCLPDSVYVCQKDHRHRCNFFLWASDAETREKFTLLSNSRTEAPSPSTTPQTASSKTAPAHRSSGLLTPQTGQQDRHGESRARRSSTSGSGSANAKARMMTEDTDEFEWDDSMDNEMERVLESSQPLRQPEFGLPARKTSRMETVTSPGKRKRSLDDDGAEERGKGAPITPGGPGQGTGVGGQGTSFLTPTPTRYKDVIPGVGESPLAMPSDLAMQVSKILEGHGVDVPVAARAELKELLNRHELKAKGILRGRDISWKALKNKDEQIARLNERISILESERELDRTVRGGR